MASSPSRASQRGAQQFQGPLPPPQQQSRSQGQVMQMQSPPDEGPMDQDAKSGRSATSGFVPSLKLRTSSASYLCLMVATLEMAIGLLQFALSAYLVAALEKECDETDQKCLTKGIEVALDAQKWIYFTKEADLFNMSKARCQGHEDIPKEDDPSALNCPFYIELGFSIFRFLFAFALFIGAVVRPAGLVISIVWILFTGLRIFVMFPFFPDLLWLLILQIIFVFLVLNYAIVLFKERSLRKRMDQGQMESDQMYGPQPQYP